MEKMRMDHLSTDALVRHLEYVTKTADCPIAEGACAFGNCQSPQFVEELLRRVSFRQLSAAYERLLEHNAGCHGLCDCSSCKEDRETLANGDAARA